MTSEPKPGDLVLLSVEVDDEETVLFAVKLQWAVHQATQEQVLTPGTLRSLLEAIKANTDTMAGAALKELYLRTDTFVPYLNDSELSDTSEKASEKGTSYKFNLHCEDSWAAYWLACRTRLKCKAPQIADHYRLQLKDSSRAKVDEDDSLETSKEVRGLHDQIDELRTAIEELQNAHKASHNEVLNYIMGLKIAINSSEKGSSGDMASAGPGTQHEPQKGSDAAEDNIFEGKGEKVEVDKANSRKGSDVDWVLESATTSPKLTA